MVLAKIERSFFSGFGINVSEINKKTALHDRKKLLDSAKESIKIVSEEIPNLDDLEIPLDRGVEVEVITGPAYSQMDFIPLTRKGAKVYELSETPYKQYDIVDDNHLRYEIELPGGEGKQFIFHGGVHSNIPGFLKNFEKLKEKAEER